MLKDEIDEINNNIQTQIIMSYSFYKGMDSRKNFRYKSIVETNLYVMTIQSDLVNAVVGLTNSNTEIQMKFYARALSVILYEYLKDLSSILGKELIDNLKAIGFLDPIEGIKKLNKEYSNLRKARSKELRTIRHKTFAHKSKNRIELIDTIFNVDVKSIENLASDIILLNGKLTRLSTKIFKYIGDYHRENGEL
ncbi:hypothetical protein BST97_09910 [Nonlabens spongiae]|uniref:HEPN AbiU2-like domain-containing protein n=1 Tax=Nonlabens spongiae TaxID=331648 RepID=A0A1W6MLD6_9FLAO|nr:hypothetical protein [Nonlabens spongiae]ARN78279.1 hypothetical protein BST97_09910 [Nonlabens spongiae]